MTDDKREDSTGEDDSRQNQHDDQDDDGDDDDCDERCTRVRELLLLLLEWSGWECAARHMPVTNQPASAPDVPDQLSSAPDVPDQPASVPSPPASERAWASLLLYSPPPATATVYQYQINLHQYQTLVETLVGKHPMRDLPALISGGSVISEVHPRGAHAFSSIY